MKELVKWSASTLYLGVGIILGCTIMLVGGFDMGMAVGGVIAIISVSIYALCAWKSLRTIKKHEDMPSK